MKTIQLLLILALGLNLQEPSLAHDANYPDQIQRSWYNQHHQVIGVGNYFKHVNDTVYIESANGKLEAFQISSFSTEDQLWLRSKINKITLLNKPLNDEIKISDSKIEKFYLLLTFILAGALMWSFGIRPRTKPIKSAYWLLFVLIAGASFWNFTSLPNFPLPLPTDPLKMDSAFMPFKPHIKTRWDNTYFFVESNGLPTTHSMMTGITAWQRQVPIPQCYTGANAWKIPINPELAATPVPVDPNHFIRGAIAVAVNGIPIFNPYTNTGVDALLDGQLDRWGGHSGRADDYHYHVAPLHLYSLTQPTQPIAFALDGFAVYGELEPDGSPMSKLDVNHGHFGTDNVYHYHGEAKVPYMIGKMVGKVTEDSTLQIVPQPSAKPVRPSLTPLKGAEIVGFFPLILKTGFALHYTLNNRLDSIQYYWTDNGQYTYDFYSAGALTREMYTGSKPCYLTTDNDQLSNTKSTLLAHPNPSGAIFHIQRNENEIFSVFQSYLVNADGVKFMFSESPQHQIDLTGFPKGIYWLVEIVDKEHKSIPLILF